MPTKVRRPCHIPVAFAWLFVAMTVFLCLLVYVLGGRPFGGSSTQDVSGAAAGERPASGTFPITCVVIDAGHGGEDGGASSAEGLVEKDVNLAVAMALRVQLEAAGVPTVMTRTEDKLLYDHEVDYHGRKKILDLAARRTIYEATEGCLFVSIHMNAFPQTQYSGMQVWYGTADERSQAIAMAVQTGSVALMPENRRKVKAAGSSIFLLDRAECPAILVECGFLSNPAEAARLGDETYQNALATVIFGAIMPYIGENSETCLVKTP